MRRRACHLNQPRWISALTGRQSEIQARLDFLDVEIGFGYKVAWSAW